MKSEDKDSDKHVITIGNVEITREDIKREEVYVDLAIINDTQLEPDERWLRSRQAWETRLAMENAAGDRVMMPDPFRSIALDTFGQGTVMDDINKIIIEQSYERILEESGTDANTVAVARISQLKNIAELSSGYSSLANAILSLGEALSINMRVQTYNGDGLDMISYEKQVKLGDKVTVNDLRHICALILTKARVALDYRESQSKQIANKDRDIETLKATLQQANAAVLAMKALPKPSPIDGHKYVLAGNFVNKKTGHTVIKYAFESEQNIWRLTTILSKATRFAQQDKVVKQFVWLLANQSEHTIDFPARLKVFVINVVEDTLSPENLTLVNSFLPKQ